MYKKILSVILAGLMLVSFAGCSNKEADKSESNELVLFNANLLFSSLRRRTLQNR